MGPLTRQYESPPKGFWKGSALVCSAEFCDFVRQTEVTAQNPHPCHGHRLRPESPGSDLPQPQLFICFCLAFISAKLSDDLIGLFGTVVDNDPASYPKSMVLNIMTQSSMETPEFKSWLFHLLAA